MGKEKSFMPEGDDGVHLGGACGWVEAEDDADAHADKKGQHNA